MLHENTHSKYKDLARWLRAVHSGQIFSPLRSAASVVTESQSRYLRGRDVLEGTPFLQIPDHHETSSVANNHLVWVYGILLQGLYVLQIPAADIVVWDTDGDGGVKSRKRGENKNEYQI